MPIYLQMKNERKSSENGKRYLSYIRVSTKRQGESGLGLEAQQKAVADFARNNGGEVVAEYVEIETGKRSDRPQLTLAINRCKNEGLTLLVAKLDRLARNLHFITTLQHSKVDFLAVDNPHATPLMIHIYSAFAEAEAVAISTRTRQALQAFVARGGVLGNPRYAEALPKANAARCERAKEYASKMAPVIAGIRSAGVSTLQGISDALNRLGHATRQGKQFSPSHVWNLLESIKTATA